MNQHGNNEDTDQFRTRIAWSLRIMSWFSLSVILVLALMDLAGWIAGVEWLKNFGSGWVPMKVVGGIGFLLVSVSLAVLTGNRQSGLKRFIPVVSGIIIIVISLLSLFAWIRKNTSGVEASLSEAPVFRLFLSSDLRIPALSASIFLVIGIIIILLTRYRERYTNLAHILCIPAGIASYLIIAAYFLNLVSEPDFFTSPVSFNSGLAFSASVVAFLSIRPGSWLMRVYTSPELGGLMARRLTPLLIVIPVLIGGARIFGEQSGLFISETGVLMVAMVYTFMFTTLIWYTGRSLNHIERQRNIAGQKLKESYSDLEIRVRERTSELLDLNRTLDTEIKERKKAEELVVAERTRMEGLLELIPAYLILLTPDYHVAYSNRFFRERFGVSGGKRCFEFLFNRTEPCEKCETYRTFEVNRPLTWEWTGPDKHIYSIYDFPYTDSDGSPLIMEMGIDITDLKNAEATLMDVNVKLEERVRERTGNYIMANERLNILSETSSLLLASENPQELVNSLCTRVMKFLDCQVFFNFLSDDSKEKLHLNACSGIPEKTIQKLEWLDYGVAVCGCVARDGKRIIAENIQETPDIRTELVKSLGVRAYACHPLLTHDKVIGTLSFGTKTRNTFSEDDLSLMKTVTDQVAIALTRTMNEERLRKSEERYRKLLELSPSACLVNRNDSIELLNPAARQLLGINSEREALGSSPLNFFHPDYHSKIKERLEKVKNGENIQVLEEKIIRKDGEIRDIEVVSVAMIDAMGPAYQIIMNDITDRKIAEKELFDTKNYLQNLIDNANAPIIVWDQENKIRLFNHAFEHLTGYNSSEVEGRKLDLLFPKDTYKESIQKIRSALTEDWKTIEIPILTKDKNIRLVLWNSAKVYDKNRKSFSTIAQGNDITERIEAEQASNEARNKLDIALENGKIGIWNWDLNTDEFIADERMERILGRAPGSFEKTFQSFEKSIHEEDVNHVREAIKNSLQKTMPFETVFRVKHENNEINYISTKAIVERDKKGNPVRVSGVCFDITDMKMGAEKALFALNEELLRSNKELEQFAYIASHDLQEPLRMVSSFTQLLAQRYSDKLDNNAQEFIRYAVDGATRMQVLINDLLNYSRIQTRGSRFSNVDLSSVLIRVVEILSLKIRERDAMVTNDDLPVIFADEGQMSQLFQNLIGNALKFCRKEPRIHISVKDEENHFLFSVKDNGIGIEPQYFERIFQIFQRLHPKDEWGGGTGIGLAICKRIVERHGGKIWVESKPGKGSVFYFTINK